MLKLPQTTMLALATLAIAACGSDVAATADADKNDGKAEYFLLRPEVEKAYGYSHAVRIGKTLKVSGAVSMDEAGTPTAVGDMAGQVENVYADLAKVLEHYGYSFDDVIVEDVFTTDMAAFLEAAAYRNEIYTAGFPTGTWLEVKGLALPEFMIEIELEAYKEPSEER